MLHSQIDPGNIDPAAVPPRNPAGRAEFGNKALLKGLLTAAGSARAQPIMVFQYDGAMTAVIADTTCGCIQESEMGKLIYFMNVSIDGYLNDKNGNFDWAEPKEDVHRYINDMEAMNDVLIYGRRMYDVLAAWENIKDIEKYPDYIQAYAKIWKSKRKIVFSRSLKECKTSDTIIKSELTADEIEKLKMETLGNISIGGADVASQALDMNLVDEIVLFIYPVAIGNGRKWINNTNMKRNRLMETKEFKNDIIMVKYSVFKREVPYEGDKT